MVHLFNELVKTIPDGVRLNTMKQNGDTLTLTGVAQSNASVATYMRNLDNSQWLKRSDLQQTIAKGNDKRDRFEFGLTVKLTSPEEKEKERAAAAEKNAAADKNGTNATDKTPPAGTPADAAKPAAAAASSESKP